MGTRLPDGPPWHVEFPGDAIATALTLLKGQTEAAVRTADAMERIADRLDSWTHDPTREPDGFGEQIAGLDSNGPELRVRRW